MAKFSDIAERLLDHKLVFTVEEAVIALQGEQNLLRWFACDCADHAVSESKKRRMTLDRRSLHALQVARQFAAGSASESARQRAAYAAKDAARSAGNGVLDAVKATVEVSPTYAAMASAEAAARAAALYGTRREEIMWQRHRLSYLCEVWAACGHRAHWLLSEGKCPIEPSDEAALHDVSLTV